MIFLHLFLANIKMLYRNRQSLFWALVFPLIFVVIFGLFRLDEATPVSMAIVDQAQDELAESLVQSLGQIKLVKLDASRSEEEARQALAKGEIDYVLLLPEGIAAQIDQGQEADLTLLYDDTQIQTNQVVRGVVEQFLGEVNLTIQGAQPLLGLNAQGIQARRIKYFDFLMPGFVGMGVMTFAVIGMASQVALYRQQRILKRIKATPLSVGTFFAAQVVAWLVLSIVQAAIILATGVFLFGAHIYGSLLWVVPLVVLANLSFLNLGFIIGSLSKNVDAANGLSNVVSMPMMFFSGVFFPTDSLPSFLQQIVRFLPLTPMLEALRGVLLKAQSPLEFPGELTLLALWVALTAVLAVRVFRFE